MSFSVDNGKVVRQSSVGILPPYAPLYRFGDIRGFCEWDVHEPRDLVYLMMCSVVRGGSSSLSDQSPNGLSWQ